MSSFVVFTFLCCLLYTTESLTSNNRMKKDIKLKLEAWLVVLHNMMRSRDKHVTFSIFYLMECSLFKRGTFRWKLQLNRTSSSKVISNWKDSQNNRKQKKLSLFLAISQNWCSWLPTDSARSQHIIIFKSTRHNEKIN